jgi:heme/copper-type cytochrome/quinol oxidase subunit 1
MQNLLNFIVKTFSTTDHKLIGQLYIYFGAISALLGSFLSMVIRIHLTTGDGSSLLYQNTSFYNTVITMHGIVMIFMFVMPVIIGGFGNVFLPIMVGSPEMAFPRLNNISF